MDNPGNTSVAHSAQSIKEVESKEKTNSKMFVETSNSWSTFVMYVTLDFRICLAGGRGVWGGRPECRPVG